MTTVSFLDTLVPSRVMSYAALLLISTGPGIPSVRRFVGNVQVWTSGALTQGSLPTSGNCHDDLVVLVLVEGERQIGTEYKKLSRKNHMENLESRS